MLPNSVLLSVAAVLVGLAQAQRTQSVWGQCGGSQYSGPTQCGQNNYCSKGNEYYYQCVPATQVADDPYYDPEETGIPEDDPYNGGEEGEEEPSDGEESGEEGPGEEEEEGEGGGEEEEEEEPYTPVPTRSTVTRTIYYTPANPTPTTQRAGGGSSGKGKGGGGGRGGGGGGRGGGGGGRGGGR